MTDHEAYELIVKYGGMKSVKKIQEMIHVGGFDLAFKNTVQVFKDRFHDRIDEQFISFLYQGLKYIEGTQTTNLN